MLLLCIVLGSMGGMCLWGRSRGLCLGVLRLGMRRMLGDLLGV